MARFLGVCYHSPKEVIAFLEKQELTGSAVQIVNHDQTLDEKPKRNVKIVLFLSRKDCGKNRTVLCSPAWAARRVIIIDSPVALWHYDLTLLDCDINADSIETFSKLKLQARRFKSPKGSLEFPQIVRKNLTEECVKQVKQIGSLLSPFMSFIYSLPSATHQKPVKIAVCHWLFYGGKPSNLDIALEILHGHVPLTVKNLDRVKAILTSEVGDRYRTAFAQVDKLRRARTETICYDSIAASLGVSAYDMRYIKSIVGAHAKFSKQELVISAEMIKLLKVPKFLQEHLHIKD